jgi:hypothetical protein
MGGGFWSAVREVLGMFKSSIAGIALPAGIAVLLSTALVAHAEIIGGGGRAKTDCLAVFDVPVDLPQRRWICTDGDACDGDGEINGECVFPVAVCANSTFDPSCTLQGVAAIDVEHSQDNGDPRFDPDFQAIQSRIDNQISPPTSDADSCTTATNVTVRVKGPFANNRCRREKKTIRMDTRSQFIDGVVTTETDSLHLSCAPAPNSCIPSSLFDSTYDRIQTQVFNTSCAVSGCHDSETTQANLLLEVGAAIGSLVNVVPTNGAAQAAGWLRVNQTVAPDGNGENGDGDAATSLLFHKVNGTLQAGMGSQMPLGQPKLNPLLIEIIRLWIEAGAPAVGWVPGTDQ